MPASARRHPGPTTAATAALAGGSRGPGALASLLDTVVAALAEGAAARGGPLPAGGPGAVDRAVAALGPVLAEGGDGAHAALRDHVRVLAAGSADPAEAHCAAHLHCPPLAVAVAADLAAAALNPSLDSWDQAPAASALEQRVTRALAAEVHPAGPAPDALVTTGGTESNLLGALLARERLGGEVTVVRGANAHHSVDRAAWLLGLPAPVVLPTPCGVLDPAAVHDALHRLARGRRSGTATPVLVVATAGTTDTGALDPLADLADVVAAHRAAGPVALHVDAAYGGALLFSQARRHRLAGLDRADSVALDLHKLGWQPVAAGLLTVPDATALGHLTHRADYLNAEDDTEAGLPDLLGRSLRTTRRPDVLKIAVTLRALGRAGLGDLVERTCAAAEELADLVAAEPALRLYARPTISTVLFRPAGATDAEVAEIRRRLLVEGRAVLGRARVHDPRQPHRPPRLWLKATLLNPHVHTDELAALVKLVLDHAPPAAHPHGRVGDPTRRTRKR